MKKKPEEAIVKASEPEVKPANVKGPEPERLKVEGDWGKAIDRPRSLG